MWASDELAALTSLDELEGILSWHGVVRDVGKEGDNEGVWASDELGTKRDGFCRLVWPI